MVSLVSSMSWSSVRYDNVADLATDFIGHARLSRSCQNEA